MLDLTSFINEYVIVRDHSMFSTDLENNRALLSERIEDKSFLVIGGAGSIGSSFIKAILPFEPLELYVVDTNENALTELTRDLRSSGIKMPEVYITYPMDYSSVTFEHMFRNHKGFDYVANFSAHKHVRSEKDIYSIEALLRNNLINAKGLLDLLSEYEPETYFCVSTDKAANPVNVMGASKRIMEDLIFSYSDKFPVKTARFANVAFSNGSLPAGFLDRLSKHQPLSAPMDVKRFFVSPEESGQICMLASMLGNNREIFFPKLKEEQMMTFDKIAEALLAEYGYEADYCESDEEAIDKAGRMTPDSRKFPVHFSVSDTSGEKPFEEFYTESESIDVSRFDSLGVVVDKAIPDRRKLLALFSNLEKALGGNTATKETIVGLLADYLPSFEHIENGLSLDGKM